MLSLKVFIYVLSFIIYSSFAACLSLKRLPPKIEMFIVYVIQVMLGFVKGEGKSLENDTCVLVNVP